MTRQELYELVWKMPVIHAAGSVGLSDKGLANKCKALDVPMPPRGYWARVSTGAKIPRPPLPELSDADERARKVLGGIPIVGVVAEPSAPERSAGKAGTTGPDPVSVRAAQVAPLGASSAVSRPVSPPSPAAAWPSPPAGRGAPTPERFAPSSPCPDSDFGFVRAAAAELQDWEAIEALLQAVTARAMHAKPDEAQRILNWVAAVRSRLDGQDPINGLLRLIGA